MRTALVMSLVFYFAGLLALGIDVGRPWNFYHVFMPWTWNLHSSLLEVAVCMPAYAFVFLLAENLPMVGERFFYRGSPAMRARVDGWRKPFRRVYPFVVAGAYMLPAMHQSSLGALMLLAGPKVHPLWQTPALPLLYLMQAGICGFAFVIVTVMLSCLVWQRPLDMKVIGALADWMSRLILVWLGVRALDLVVRGELGRVLTFDRYSILFLIENALVLIPALVMRVERWRSTPQLVFKMAVATCVGGMAYRFIPTTVTYDPGWQFSYFPAVPELLVMLGFVALALLGFSFAVKLFAVLPAPYDDWLKSPEGQTYVRKNS
jgi:Ni/Fe-hydrogenase subunit HybB-like protein